LHHEDAIVVSHFRLPLDHPLVAVPPSAPMMQTGSDILTAGAQRVLSSVTNYMIVDIYPRYHTVAVHDK
jgi:hypothetical protein